ncbi:hypothetical protein SAMN05660662_1398 [Blastococcus aurantiacus]|uniref:Uncharacterized protein n=1 Tax=Blastococcus aurantiacus TaxID=1550231 RepID=A0A1G7JAS2_9ACTN|nr:hypothetical protein [Blastococcus aurantiacus]SDF22001.1 hypothetical protein SAMN05660662_1398 [Blastococcus aurantiacus]
MTAEDPELELELEPDPGWYAVPEDEAEAAGWAEGLVRELAGPGAEDQAVLVTTESVLAHARAAYEAQVELAFVFLPQPLAPVVASCHVELVFGTAGDLPDLDDLARALAVQRPEHLSAPEVGRRLLVAGPAVRQHELREDDDGSVVERVSFVLELPRVDDALLRVTTTWRALALGDALVEQADRMAAALVVRVE